MKNEEWALLDRQALGVIQLMLSHNVAFNIAKKTAIGLMATLSNMYEKPFASNKVHLMSLVESWILDSGALYHCTSYYEVMKNYISGDFENVDLADVETLKIMRKNDIQVRLPNGPMWKFKDMIFTPTMVIAHRKKNGTLYVTSSIENIVEVVELDEK
ncbi:hypothetical protein AAG906_010085 [Vitis piasezkii]